MTLISQAMVARRTRKRSVTMSRIATAPVAQATGAAAELFGRIKQAVGSGPNTFAAIGALQPYALDAVLSADAVLAAGSLSKQDAETIKLVVSVATGCDYCIAAHSVISKMTGLSEDAVKQLRLGLP